jgi:hypothetical protein
MVNNNPDSNGKPKTKTVSFQVPEKQEPPRRTRQGRAIRQKVFDLKQITIEALDPVEWFCIVRSIIDLALAGNRDAATWIADRVIGKPTQTIDLNDFSEAQEEAPKVVLLDWRRNGIDTTAESN